MSQRPIRRMGAVAVALLALLSVLTIAGRPAAAAYPGDDGRLAVVRGNHIYTVNRFGGSLRRLTWHERNEHPSWSPDGKRIAFVRVSADGSRDLWIMRADGTHKQRVTNLGMVTGASWSPDGSTLVFGGWDTTLGVMVLHTVSATAPFGPPTELQGLLEGSIVFDPLVVELDGTPAWSPTGTHISWYAHTFPNGNVDNYLLRLDLATSEYEVVIAIGAACCGFGFFADPAYSPTGELGYTIAVDPAPPTLTAPGLATTKPRDQQLAFSPSGTRIAFMNDASGTPKVFVADRDGSHRRFVTSGSQPDWQPLP